jgi:hypothetical protein
METIQVKPTDLTKSAMEIIFCPSLFVNSLSFGNRAMDGKQPYPKISPDGFGGNSWLSLMKIKIYIL